MIQGRFDLDSNPWMQGTIRIPGIRLHSNGDVDFLVDTGAGRTSLHPSDAHRLGLFNFPLPPPSVSMIGVAGTAQYAELRAFIGFVDQHPLPWTRPRWAVYALPLLIAIPDEENWYLPSLLGQDIIRTLGYPIQCMSKETQLYCPCWAEPFWSHMEADIKNIVVWK